ASTASQTSATQIAQDLRLTPAELEERLPKGPARTFVNRCGWATTYLSRGGLLQRRDRGVYAITDRGRAALAHEGRIDTNFLSGFLEFEEFRSVRGTRARS